MAIWKRMDLRRLFSWFRFISLSLSLLKTRLRLCCRFWPASMSVSFLLSLTNSISNSPLSLSLTSPLFFAAQTSFPVWSLVVITSCEIPFYSWINEKRRLSDSFDKSSTTPIEQTMAISSKVCQDVFQTLCQSPDMKGASSSSTTVLIESLPQTMSQILLWRPRKYQQILERALVCSFRTSQD